MHRLSLGICTKLYILTFSLKYINLQDCFIHDIPNRVSTYSSYLVNVEHGWLIKCARDVFILTSLKEWSDQ